MDDASSDNTPNIIQDYIKQYPSIVRSIRQAENSGAGAARNAGMSMAKGEFIAFVDSDDCMAPQFLQRALTIMQNEAADIVAFDMVTIRQKPYRIERWGVSPGVFSGEQSLEQFALKNAGGYGSVNRVYRVDMLRKNHIAYGLTKVHEDMFFSVSAFYHSTKTVVIDDIGYYRHVRTNSLSASQDYTKHLESYAQFVAFLECFFAVHQLDTQSIAYQRMLKQIYMWDRGRIFKAIQENQDDSSLLLNEKVLQALSTSSDVIKLFLQDYARLSYFGTTPHPDVAPNRLDWQNEAAKAWPTPHCIPYKHAEKHNTPEPILSVIIPNFNRKEYLDACLKPIFKQLTDSIEIIIIDDASTDDCYALLKNYADTYPQIRLYQMQENCRQGICRNIGIEKARGKYITSVDSDDTISDTFFADSIADMQKNNADVLIYSLKAVHEDGSPAYQIAVPDQTFHGQEAFIALMNKEFSSAPHAKVFNRAFLLKHNVTFHTYTYLDDTPFFIMALQNASLCVSINKVQYIYTVSQDSSIRPQKYSWFHVHSCCQFFEFLLKIHAETKESHHDTPFIYENMKWTINDFFMPACAAFLQTKGELPLTAKQFSEIKNNPLFLQTLLTCLAKKVRQEGYDKLPTILNKRVEIPYNGIDHAPPTPLISIIIPVYNQETCLERCLNSILTQPFASFEILLINDASKDYTIQICESYAARDARIKVFSNECNRGQGYSRNFAMEKACAPYITFVDSDDFIQSPILHRGIQILEDMPDGDIEHFNALIKGTTNNDTWEVPQGKRTGTEVFKDFCHSKILAFAPWGKIYRKTLFDQHHILSPEYMWEDNFFSLQTFYYARNIVFTGQFGYTHISTTHEASTLNPVRHTPQHINGLCHLVRDIEQFGIDINNKEQQADLETFSQAFLWRFTTFFPQMHTCLQKGFFPINPDALQSLMQAPAFLRVILEHFAELHAHDTGYQAALPDEDFKNTGSAWAAPASELITLVEHPTRENIDLSVIVPAFNVSTTLTRCLDSILAQEGNFEVILVEDNSTGDNTLEICLEYAHKHDCIRLFQTAWNSGLGTVRNLGMQKAQGTYITFIDSDDWVEPNFFMHAVQNLNNHPDINILLCTTLRHYSSFKEFSKLPDTTISGEELYEKYMTGENWHWEAWGHLYKKTFLTQNNIRFANYFYEDEIFIPTIYTASDKILLSSFFAYNYICDEKAPSIMSPKIRGKKYFESSLYNLEALCDFFTKHPTIKPQLVESGLRKFAILHHRANILQFIHACKMLDLPSPLNEDALSILTKNTVFVKKLLQEYICLSQKHAEQNATHKKQQSAEQGAHNASCLEEQSSHDATSLEVASFDQILNDLKHAQKHNSWQGRLKATCKKSSRSFTGICALPITLTKTLCELRCANIPESLGDKFFSKVIKTYNSQNLSAAQKLMDKSSTSPKVNADAHTALARHVQATNKTLCAQLAFHAYIQDPKSYRLKWFLFRAYEAQLFTATKAVLVLLSEDTPLKNHESEKLQKIRETITQSV